MQALSSCSKWGLLFSGVCGLLFAVVPLVEEQQVLEYVGFSSGSVWAQLW